MLKILLIALLAVFIQACSTSDGYYSTGYSVYAGYPYYGPSWGWYYYDHDHDHYDRPNRPVPDKPGHRPDRPVRPSPGEGINRPDRPSTRPPSNIGRPSTRPSPRPSPRPSMGGGGRIGGGARVGGGRAR